MKLALSDDLSQIIVADINTNDELDYTIYKASDGGIIEIPEGLTGDAKDEWIKESIRTLALTEDIEIDEIKEI